jgi:hypothetical protein
MIDVYFPNSVFLLLPLIEALLMHRSSRRVEGWNSQTKLLVAESSFAVSLVLAVLPTFITRWIFKNGTLHENRVIVNLAHLHHVERQGW